ncbi:T-cell surface glycoprotein CD5-like [Sinocyclocheilus rhinocerous]|uniref:T-cell surface glycoprotein CD5-like n=1 Tax=Sinocyclocheilus rhinocerous TaxID=307959 RepID=UPI0007B91E43|nr:PREDICTED: T-cell surface glycoprotein CD5-like [Sinocyclocheilus rhinocerous]
MENSLLMTLAALLLLGVQGISTQTPTQTNNLTIPSTSQWINVTTSTAPQTPCPIIIHNITKSVLYRLRVKWLKGSPCEGQLYLYTHERQRPLCSNSHKSGSWWTEVCKDTRCGDFKGFKPTSSQTKCFMLTSNMTIIDTTECKGLHIMCQDSLGTELAAYKAVTGILIFLILGVILVQFSRPTYKALHKRFSQKRQSRWIGPTQSVCYHRGQGPATKNTEKRQSFPGLERLTVNQSREPSSNRNSDYDSYGYS